MVAELVLRPDSDTGCGIPPVPLVPPWTFAGVHGDPPKRALSRGLHTSPIARSRTFP
jgi:hypothetical protein